MKKTYQLIFAFLLFYSCQENLNEIFVDKRVQNIFEEFIEEAKTSSYKDGDKIFISVYSKLAENDWCMSFDNIKYYASDDNFAKFKYKGFSVYVNENVPKSIIKFEKFNQSGNFSPPQNFLPHPQEFLETYICFQSDSLNVKRVNFEKKEYFNIWKTIK